MENQNQQKGIQLFEIGRFDEAINFLKASLSENPEDGTSKFFIALCYLNTKKFKDAEKIASALQSEEPDNPDVFYLKAMVKFHLNNDKEALILIDLAIGMSPNNEDYFALKADILLHLKRYEDALQFANKSLEIDAKHSHSLNLRAKVLTKLDRNEEAANTVENILYDNPEDDYSHANVGWVELENGNVKKALIHFKEALTLNPNFEYARQGMSTALKGKNFLYALYLKYSFWISKQSSKNQWVFIIGIYLVYRFSVKLLTGLGLSYIAIPLIILYLLFALGGWLMEPISNTILNFDTYGKYLLNSNEKKSGYAFGSLLLIGLISAGSYYLLSIDYLLVISVTSICLLLTFPRSFLLISEKGKNLAQIYSLIMMIIGIGGSFFFGNWTAGAIVFGMMILYTWIGNFIEDL
ncbi:MAG: tetratricopeptide repeat protein [Flavobacteriaceae bacterium]